MLSLTYVCSKIIPFKMNHTYLFVPVDKKKTMGLFDNSVHHILYPNVE